MSAFREIPTFEDIDDGHHPGNCQGTTKLAINDGLKDPSALRFFSVFDNLLPEDWCDFAYNYAINVKKNKPWGNSSYISISYSIFETIFDFSDFHRRCIHNKSRNI